ncbi:MFS general substrate transporter [Hypoxylon sp. FL0890]|nr:MFS general substrate transporter [Hypoxylon sp. FL0890]
MFSRQRLTQLAARLVPRAQPGQDGQAIQLVNLNNNGTPVNVPASQPPQHTARPAVDHLAKKAFTRIDLHILPFVGLAIEIDRVLFGLYNSYFKVVLGFTATQYNMVALAREIGYILGQIPSNLVLNTLDKPAFYFSAITLAWAVLQLIRLSMSRFITVFFGCLASGILESAFFYPRREIGKKVSLLVIMLPLARIILAAFGEPDHSLSTSSGGLGLRYRCYLVGLGVMLCLTTALPEAERRVVLSRLANSYGWPHPGSYENERITWLDSLKGLWLACLDPKTWFLAAICFFVSFPIPWLSDLRHLTQILLPITKPSLITIAVSITLAYHLCAAYIGGLFTSMFKTRGLILNIFQGIAFISCVSIIQSELIISKVKVEPAQPLFLAALVSLPVAYFCLATALTWVLNCMPWDRSKRAACVAIITTLMSISNIYALFTPPLNNREEGRSLNLILVCLLLILIFGAMASAFLLRLTLRKDNRWLNRNNGPNPQPGLQARRWLQNPRFQDPAHTFRFLV